MLMPASLLPQTGALGGELAGLIGGLAISAALAALFALRRRQRRLREQTVLLNRLEELEALHNASSAIASAELDLTALAALVADEAGKVIDNRTFQIGLFEGNRYRLLYWRINGKLQDTPISFELQENAGLIGWVRQHRRPLLVGDFLTEWEHLPAHPIYVSPNPPRSALFIPLISGQEVIGVLAAQHPEPQQFKEADAKRLAIFANQAAGAIANARLYERERERADDLALVSAISRQVNALGDPSEIFQQVVVIARERLAFHPVLILSIDPATGEALSVESSISGLDPGSVRVRPGVGLVGTAVATRQTVVVNDVSQDERYIDAIGVEVYDRSAQHTQAEIAIPLLFEDQLLGVLDVQSSRSGGISQREQALLEALANEIAAAIDKARKNAQQREQAWMTTAQLQVAQAMQEHSALEYKLDAVVRLLALMAGVELCAILTWDVEQEVYQPAACYGLSTADAQRLRQMRLAIGKWRPLDAVHVGQLPLTTAQAPPWTVKRQLTQPLTLYPMTAKETQWGVLLVEERPLPAAAQELAQRRRELLQGIALQVGQEVERVQLRAAQQEEAWVNTALLQVAEAMNRLIDLNEILATIVRLASMLTGVQSCLVLIWDEAHEAFRAGPGYGIGPMGRALLDSAPFDSSEFLSLRAQDRPTATETQVYQAELPRWMADALGVEAADILPLNARNRLVGALLVGPTVDRTPLHGRRLNILVGIAQQAAIAVVNDALYREAAERQRIERELAVALEIQASLLPDGSPHIPGLDVASLWEAARQVSGDFYDFLELPNGNWGIVIADVAGKGVPAAIFMALCRTIIRSVGFNRLEPAVTLHRANQIIVADTASDLFVTVFYAVWDPLTATLHYTNGGHNPPLLLRADGAISPLPGNGVALGVIEDIPVTQLSIALQPGDTVVLYTDGVTEAMNLSYELFGVQRLKNALLGRQQQQPAAIIAAVQEAVHGFVDGMAQSDDVTMVVVQRIDDHAA